jgi:hypothetical protein
MHIPCASFIIHSKEAVDEGDFGLAKITRGTDFQMTQQKRRIHHAPFLFVNTGL